MATIIAATVFAGLSRSSGVHLRFADGSYPEVPLKRQSHSGPAAGTRTPIQPMAGHTSRTHKEANVTRVAAAAGGLAADDLPVRDGIAAGRPGMDDNNSTQITSQ
jgi:hypothetical protein